MPLFRAEKSKHEASLLFILVPIMLLTDTLAVQRLEGVLGGDARFPHVHLQHALGVFSAHSVT